MIWNPFYNVFYSKLLSLFALDSNLQASPTYPINMNDLLRLSLFVDFFPKRNLLYLL